MTDAIVEPAPRLEQPAVPAPITPALNRVSQPVMTVVAASLAAVIVSFVSGAFRSTDQAKVQPQVARATRPVRETIQVGPVSRVIGRDGMALAVEPRPQPINVARPTEPPRSPQAATAHPTDRGSVKNEDARTPVEWTPEFRTKWSHLNRTMSRTAVRALLGEPKWVDNFSTPTFEYWLYKDPSIRGEGWIAFFDHGGSVYKWWDSSQSAARDPN